MLLVCLSEYELMSLGLSYSHLLGSGGSTVSLRNGFMHCSSLLFDVTRRVPSPLK